MNDVTTVATAPTLEAIVLDGTVKPIAITQEGVEGEDSAPLKADELKA